MRELCKKINSFLTDNWIAKMSRSNAALIVIGRPHWYGAVALEFEGDHCDIAVYPNDTPKVVADGGHDRIDPWYWTRETGFDEIRRAIEEAIQKL